MSDTLMLEVKAKVLDALLEGERRGLPAIDAAYILMEILLFDYSVRLRGEWAHFQLMLKDKEVKKEVNHV
jgi:hypothetical protein